MEMTRFPCLDPLCVSVGREGIAKLTSTFTLYLIEEQNIKRLKEEAEKIAKNWMSFLT